MESLINGGDTFQTNPDFAIYGHDPFVASLSQLSVPSDLNRVVFSNKDDSASQLTHPLVTPPCGPHLRLPLCHS
ncbi:unnamed protein product [Arabis nemorensis]|uniref:Uncharacterized protein n=1 Tax=Arabis nemorensis TaxID=586526 RepID=A0A565BV73_9BRAS|nr:unnamed protein product [Arabis nemorensis]